MNIHFQNMASLLKMPIQTIVGKVIIIHFSRTWLTNQTFYKLASVLTTIKKTSGKYLCENEEFTYNTVSLPPDLL